MSKREPGLDLLRCIALLCVVIFHSFLYNGYYYQPQTGLSLVLAGSLRWLSTTCIGLFLMLTGYLQSCKTDLRACWRRMVPVLAGYFLASAISIPVRHFVFGDVRTLAQWIQGFAEFGGVYYGWYVEMYVGMVLLMPFLNRVMAHLDGKSHLSLAAVLLVLTALPGATPIPILPDHWRFLYPVTYYVLGAAVRRFQPKCPPWLGLLGAAAVALAMGIATVLSTDGVLSTALTWEFADIWVAMMALCLFIGLYRVDPGKILRHICAFAAGGCYGGYLLSHLLDHWVYTLLPQWQSPFDWVRSLFLLTIPVYLISILSGRLLQAAVNLLLFLGKKVAPCKP